MGKKYLMSARDKNGQPITGILGGPIMVHSKEDLERRRKEAAKVGATIEVVREFTDEELMSWRG